MNNARSASHKTMTPDAKAIGAKIGVKIGTNAITFINPNPLASGANIPI